MKVKALEKQAAIQAKALEDARARVTATDEDLERFRQQQRRTPEGGLRQELYRLGAAKAEAQAQVFSVVLFGCIMFRSFCNEKGSNCLFTVLDRFCHFFRASFYYY